MYHYKWYRLINVSYFIFETTIIDIVAVKYFFTLTGLFASKFQVLLYNACNFLKLEKWKGI